jgi:hypothetical protein
MASTACRRILSPFASQMTLQVSSRTAVGVAVTGAVYTSPR